MAAEPRARMTLAEIESDATLRGHALMHVVELVKTLDAHIEQLEAALRAILDTPSEHDLDHNAVIHAMAHRAAAALEDTE